MPAATVRLFYEDCNFEHVATSDSGEAAELIRAGNTVCVPTAHVAIETLIVLGLTHAQAVKQISHLAPERVKSELGK